MVQSGGKHNHNHHHYKSLDRHYITEIWFKVAVNTITTTTTTNL
jgi:hypothetical protein